VPALLLVPLLLATTWLLYRGIGRALAADDHPVERS
jgi:hypothetical protein